MSSRVTAAVATLVLALAFATEGVAAAVAPADPADGLYVAFKGEAPGLLLLDRITDDGGKLSLALRGLAPGASYRLTGSRARCSEAGSPAKTAFQIRIDTDPYGAVFTVRTLTGGAGLVRARSVRLMEEEGIFYRCRPTHRFDLIAPATMTAPEVADAAGAAYSRFHGPGTEGLTLIKVGAGTLTMTFALAGLTPGVHYRIVVSPLTTRTMRLSPRTADAVRL